MNRIDTMYAEFLGTVIEETLTDALSRTPIMNEEALKDIVLAECMDRVSYDEMKIDIQCICKEIVDREAIKLVNMLNGGRGI